ncbi:quinone oxidoreductase, partial [Pseudomonas syringae]|uniref:alcohol dehydrogenase catalytic domain-containing protein n=1 Tax=Pseudomonas syringae TaxID=317 RepID=UPI000D41DE1B
MAKRIQFSTVGGPEVLEYVDFEPQAPGPQAVVVRNKAIGLNFIDTYYRSGLYPAPLPSGLGAEGAGVVEAVGAEVTRFKVGDRVAYGTGPLGGYSEGHGLPEANLGKLGGSISFEQAAAPMLQGLTN